MFTCLYVLGVCISIVHLRVDVGQLDSDIASVFACQTNPALAVSVVVDGKSVFSRGYGASDPGNSTKTTERTIFGIASLSKAFAATLLLKLLHRHK